MFTLTFFKFQFNPQIPFEADRLSYQLKLIAVPWPALFYGDYSEEGHWNALKTEVERRLCSWHTRARCALLGKPFPRPTGMADVGINGSFSKAGLWQAGMRMLGFCGKQRQHLWDHWKWASCSSWGWNSGRVNLCQLFSWLGQLLFQGFCLALPPEIAILIKYLLFCPNSVLKSMPASPDTFFFFPFNSHALWISGVWRKNLKFVHFIPIVHL